MHYTRRLAMPASARRVNLGCNARLLVARQCPSRSRHRHKPRGRPVWNDGRKIRAGLNCETCCSPIERDARCSSESLSEKLDGLPFLAQVRKQGDECWEISVEGVEHPTITGTRRHV